MGKKSYGEDGFLLKFSGLKHIFKENRKFLREIVEN